jgi:hypothetical protein
MTPDEHRMWAKIKFDDVLEQLDYLFMHGVMPTPDDAPGYEITFRKVINSNDPPTT